MTELFEKRTTWLDSPGKHAAAITPSDGADLPTACRAFWHDSSRA